MKTAIDLAERGVVPDALVRRGIRKLLRRRLRDERARQGPDREAALARWIAEMRRSPVALVPDVANRQHYEVPAELFECALGPHMKYSACLWSEGVADLGAAEEAMLALTAERARLEDGMEVLELGCGWGSFTLWAARRFPRSRILAVSNSASQRRHVLARARTLGLSNVEVLTRDVNDLETDRRFDRVVSVEMFEHLRNWEACLGRIRGWLADDGRVFLHVFAHRELCYPFEDGDASDWMARWFFSGGMMPSDDLLPRLSTPFSVEEHAVVDGTHYSRTAEAWLANLDAHRAVATGILARLHGHREARIWFQRWRLFFLACAELFGYREGSEWVVSHYLLRPESPTSPPA